MSLIIKPPLVRLRRDHPLAKGLVCAPFLYEGSGNRVHDVSGYDRHGTITGASWLKNNGKGWTLDFSGGSSNLVNLGTFTVLGEITILAWLWYDSFNAGRDDRWISKADGTGAANHDFMLGHVVSSGNKMRCRIGRVNFTSVGTQILPTGQWFMAAVTFADADQMSQLYYNGNPDGAAAWHAGGGGSPALPNNANAVYIGNQPTSTSSAPDAKIERVMIWQRRLSAAEIKELYLDPNALFQTPRKYFLFHTSGGGGGVTGDLAATLPNLSCSSTAAAAIAGTATPTIAAPTSSANGTVAVSGNGTATMAAPTLSSAGTVAIDAQASATIAGPTLAAAGTVAIAGTTNATLGNVSCAGVAAVTVTGSTNATLPNLSLSADGTVTVPGGITATVDATLGNLTSSSTGTVSVAGVVTVTLEGLSLGCAADVSVTASADATIGNLTLSAQGTVDTGTIISDSPVSGFFVRTELAAKFGGAQLSANWRVEQIEAGF